MAAKEQHAAANNKPHKLKIFLWPRITPYLSDLVKSLVSSSALSESLLHLYFPQLNKWKTEKREEKKKTDIFNDE